MEQPDAIQATLLTVILAVLNVAQTLGLAYLAILRARDEHRRVNGSGTRATDPLPAADRR